MEPETIRRKVEEIAATGVDYIKIGFFPFGQLTACIEVLQPLASHKKLIAVLFADHRNDLRAKVWPRSSAVRRIPRRDDRHG